MLIYISQILSPLTPQLTNALARTQAIQIQETPNFHLVDSEFHPRHAQSAENLIPVSISRLLGPVPSHSVFVDLVTNGEFLPALSVLQYGYHQRFVDGGGGVFSEFEFDSILATWLLSFFASSIYFDLSLFLGLLIVMMMESRS